MCGIAGEVRFDNRTASVNNVTRMMHEMTSRGPDARGVIAMEKVVLGHRRLKIIDLSGKAQQPMNDPHLGLSLVFNGCIYNYKTLRKQLEKKGYLFFSNSDSEVILKAYHAWGNECVDKFNGMFAIAMHERDSGRLFLARDRLGIKPLYFIKTPGFLRFASSLPALVKTLSREPEIDSTALHHYLTFHSVVPAPRTIFENVRKLYPGTTLTFDNAGIYTERRYWQIDFSRREKEISWDNEGELIERLLIKLRKSAKLRTEADVPVGVLLSGGVDSSLVVGLLAELDYADLNTFSVGFDDSPEEAGNEFRYSDIIASEFGTRHHRFTVDSREIVANLPNCFQAMSEPMVSHDNIGFYLLSKWVSQHVKVVQSGQGADEIFGGYHWYQGLNNSREPVADYAKAFFDRDHDEYSRVVSDRFINGNHSLAFVQDNFSKKGASHPVDKALRLDITVMLTDDPVKRVDNMTMAWGLEARVPFLDHELVEFVAQIPPRFKLKNGGKYILKEAARHIIPSEVIDRPKGYFPVPALKYLRDDVLEYVVDALNCKKARERKLFERPYVEKLIDDPLSHITPLQGSKLWQLATLELWLQSHGI